MKQTYADQEKNQYQKKKRAKSGHLHAQAAYNHSGEKVENWWHGPSGKQSRHCLIRQEGWVWS